MSNNLKKYPKLDIDENKDNDDNYGNSEESEFSKKIGNKSKKKNNDIMSKSNKPTTKKRKNNKSGRRKKENGYIKEIKDNEDNQDSKDNDSDIKIVLNDCEKSLNFEGLSNLNILNVTNELFSNDYNLNPKRSASKMSLTKEKNSVYEIDDNNGHYLNKKVKKGKIIDKYRKEQESRILLALSHTDPQYKRRKIKIGINRQCDMLEFTNKTEKNINFEEEIYERNDLRKMWSKEENILSENELNEYIRIARLFWEYKNPHLEEDTCQEFYNYCNQIIMEKSSEKKMNERLKKKISTLIEELKKIVRRGIELESHCDEISFKVLYLCKYNTKMALLCLYNRLNPFIEEIEEGFKHDLCFFQDEIKSFILNGDLYEEDDK